LWLTRGYRGLRQMAMMRGAAPESEMARYLLRLPTLILLAGNLLPLVGVLF